MDRRDTLLKMREADESDPDVPYMLAQEYARFDEHDTALRWYDVCIELDPAYHYAYYHKAKSLEAMDRMSEALETVEVGLARARADNAQQAMSELEAYFDDLS